MEKQENLKIKNTPMLWVFLSANILILGTIVLPPNIQKIIQNLNITLILKSLGITIAPLLLFLLNGIVSSHQKAVLIFWKFKNPLPGSQAFSKLIKKDSRIDKDKLRATYGSLPKSPSEQNKLWYKIYKKNSTNTVVIESHRAFLLARDLTSLSVLFIIFIGLPFLLFGKWPFNIYYFLGLIFQYAGIAIGAQNRGERFVTNVLAIESSS